MLLDSGDIDLLILIPIHMHTFHIRIIIIHMHIYRTISKGRNSLSEKQALVFSGNCEIVR